MTRKHVVSLSSANKHVVHRASGFPKNTKTKQTTKVTKTSRKRSLYCKYLPFRENNTDARGGVGGRVRRGQDDKIASRGCARSGSYTGKDVDGASVGSLRASRIANIGVTSRELCRRGRFFYSPGKMCTGNRAFDF